MRLIQVYKNIEKKERNQSENFIVDDINRESNI